MRPCSAAIRRAVQASPGGAHPRSVRRASKPGFAGWPWNTPPSACLFRRTAGPGRPIRTSPLSLVKVGGAVPARAPFVMLSNSFAFGGSNCSLILGGRALMKEARQSPLPADLPPLAELMPHGAERILLKSVRAFGEKFVECEAVAEGPDLFLDQEGNVPAWTGLSIWRRAPRCLPASRPGRAAGRRCRPGARLPQNRVRGALFSRGSAHDYSGRTGL